MTWRAPAAQSARDTARLCIDAGVGFVTAPSLNPAIMEFAAKQNVAVLPGALTQTEVVTAWSASADSVKVFPSGPVGGVSPVCCFRRF